MYIRYYTLLSHWFLAHPRALGVLRLLDAQLVYIFVGIYGLMILVALGSFVMISPAPGSTTLSSLAQLIGIPALSLATTMILRRFLRVERPRVRYHITPLIPHNDATTAFPSKHAASACAIFWAGVFWWGFGIPTVIVGVLGLCVGMTRIIGGAHMPRDVLAGYALSSLFALLYLI